MIRIDTDTAFFAVLFTLTAWLTLQGLHTATLPSIEQAIVGSHAGLHALRLIAGM